MLLNSGPPGFARSKSQAFTLIEVVSSDCLSLPSSLGFCCQRSAEGARSGGTGHNAPTTSTKSSSGCITIIRSEGSFPPGFETMLPWGEYVPGPIQCRMGMVLLRPPYIEQENIAQLMGVVAHNSVWGWSSDLLSDQRLQPTQLNPHSKIFRCPSDTGPPLNPARLNHAMSNYRAVAGPYTDPYISVNMDFGGVFWQNSNIRITDITDGSSNTLAIGECMYNEQTGQTACIWAGMSGWVAPGASSGSVHISDVMWYVDNATAQINGSAPQAFSSRHPCGAMFAFADGSVRSFINDMGPNALRWLAGRMDGVVVDPDF